MACHGGWDHSIRITCAIIMRSSTEKWFWPKWTFSRSIQHCEGGSVGDLIYNMAQKNRKLNEPLIGYIVRELINALSYLHMNHIVHRDVKASNILLTQDGQVKLTDFGFSRWVAWLIGLKPFIYITSMLAGTWSIRWADGRLRSDPPTGWRRK